MRVDLHSQLRLRVRGQVPVGTRMEAERAIAATLGAIAERLPTMTVRTLADRVPWPPTAPPEVEEIVAADPLDSFYRRVADLEGVPRAAAVEHAHVVCRGLGELADPETRALLVRQLPVAIAVLLAPRTLPIAPTAPGHTHTLAEGRPGGSHPLVDPTRRS